MTTQKTPWSMWLFRMQLVLVVLIPIFIVSYRAGWLDLQSGFLGASFLILAAAAFAVVGVFVALWGMVKVKVMPGAIGTVLLGALPLAAMVKLVLSGGFSVPPIHDISTDVFNPPNFKTVKELRAKTDNSLEYGGAKLVAQQQQAYPNVKTIETDLSLPEAHKRALAVVTDMGWKVVAEDAQTGHIEAVVSSAVFGFKDDVVVRSRVAEQGVVVDLRSASRVGISDLGANAKRILSFSEAFSQ